MDWEDGCEVIFEYWGTGCRLLKCAFCGDWQWVAFGIDDKGGTRQQWRKLLFARGNGSCLCDLYLTR